MSESEEIKRELLKINNKIDTVHPQKPAHWLKYWLPLILVVVNFIGAVWFASRYTYRIESDIKTVKETSKDLKVNQSVIIEFMEDSLGYNHRRMKIEYEVRQDYIKWLKSGGSQSRGVSEKIVKLNN